MTDDDLIEQLHRFAGYLDGTTPLTMSMERISKMVACHLKAIARSFEIKCPDCHGLGHCFFPGYGTGTCPTCRGNGERQRTADESLSD